MSEKVLIGMSGGVDSSVAVYLLKSGGCDVMGATLLLNGGNGGWRDAADAQHVAEQMGMEHRELPAYDAFSQYVKKYFADAYIAGETPNPCVICNKYVKFGFLLDWALKHGFDKVATGHYARIKHDKTSDRWLLMKASDVRKDQSYFLYTLTQEKLARMYFPLGTLTKEQVRGIADNVGLSCAERPDSQDICFVPDGDYQSFIENYTGRSFPAGDIVDMSGAVLGRHEGIVGYTIGQRRGLGVSGGRPLYVVKKDIEKNTVVLGDEKDLFTNRLRARDLNWIAVAPPESVLRVQAKVRFSQTSANALVFPEEDGRVTVEFLTPQRAVTAGQSVVFYYDDVVVGGGIIE